MTVPASIAPCVVAYSLIAAAVPGAIIIGSPSTRAISIGFGVGVAIVALAAALIGFPNVWNYKFLLLAAFDDAIEFAWALLCVQLCAWKYGAKPTRLIRFSGYGIGRENLLFSFLWGPTWFLLFLAPGFFVRDIFSRCT